MNPSVLSPALVVLSFACLSIGVVGLTMLKREKARFKKLLEEQQSVNRDLDKQLAENENRLRVIIESEPELVVLQGADGRILEMNPAGLAIADAEVPEEIIGKSIHSIVAPEFRNSYEALSEAVFHGEAGILEFRVVGLKNSVHWLEMHAFPLRDARNRIIALTGIARDITRRKQAEEETRRHQTELARVARLNTMGEMASGIAHELNQPLSAISNFADGCMRRIRRGSTTHESLVEALEQICHQTDRAGQIIRHMRNFARKREPVWAAVDVNGVIQEVWGFLEPEARQNCIVILLDVAGGLPPVMGNHIELEQVIVNLVRNAVEAMADPAVRVREITISTRLRGSRHIEVRVADTGPGVSPQMAGQVFDPFYTTKASGMGMGLSISRSIIEAHGGRLWLAATETPGACFIFTLPAGAAALPYDK